MKGYQRHQSAQLTEYLYDQQGVQPYLDRRVSQSSHQPYYSAEEVGAPCILSSRGVLPLKKRFSHKFILLKI